MVLMFLCFAKERKCSLHPGPREHERSAETHLSGLALAGAEREQRRDGLCRRTGARSNQRRQPAKA